MHARMLFLHVRAHNDVRMHTCTHTPTHAHTHTHTHTRTHAHTHTHTLLSRTLCASAHTSEDYGGSRRHFRKHKKGGAPGGRRPLKGREPERLGLEEKGGHGSAKRRTGRPGGRAERARCARRGPRPHEGTQGQRHGKAGPQQHSSRRSTTTTTTTREHQVRPRASAGERVAITI